MDEDQFKILTAKLDEIVSQLQSIRKEQTEVGDSLEDCFADLEKKIEAMALDSLEPEP